MLGQRLIARDRVKAWLPAKIVKLSEEGDPPAVCVHYDGWNKKYDEWINDAELLHPLGTDVESLPKPPKHEYNGSNGQIDEEDEQWEVDKIIGKRTVDGVTLYKVQYLGSDNEGEKWPDTWEFADDISPELIEAYEELKSVRSAPSEEPYTVMYVRDNHPNHPIDGTLVEEFVDELGRSGLAMLKRQQDAYASKKIYSLKPCPAYIFAAVYKALEDLSDSLPGAHACPAALCAARAPHDRVLSRVTGACEQVAKRST